MALYTPHGLKIRLDPDAVAKVIAPLATRHDMNDVLLDVELWENLPEGFAALSASATAFFTQLPDLTIVGAVAAYAVGSFIRGLTYSDFLHRLIPLFLGRPVITLVHTITVGWYLVAHHSYLTATVLCAANAAGYLGAFTILDFFMMPIRISLRKALGLQPTHQEGVFVAICNRRAKKLGIALDWEEYTTL